MNKIENVGEYEHWIKVSLETGPQAFTIHQPIKLKSENLALIVQCTLHLFSENQCVELICQ